MPQQAVASSLSYLASFYALAEVGFRREGSDQQNPVDAPPLRVPHPLVEGLLVEKGAASHGPEIVVLVPRDGEGPAIVALVLGVPAEVAPGAHVRRTHRVGRVLQRDEEGVGRDEAPGVLHGACARKDVRVHVLVGRPVGAGDGGELDDGRIGSHDGLQSGPELVVRRQFLPVGLDGRVHVHVDPPGVPVLVLDDSPSVPLVVLFGDPVPQLRRRLVRQKVRVDGHPVGQHVLDAIVGVEVVLDRQLPRGGRREVVLVANTVVVRGVRHLTVFLLKDHQLELRVQVLVVDPMKDDRENEPREEDRQRSVHEDPSEEGARESEDLRRRRRSDPSIRIPS
mmetsp:Transcript_7461/g.18320  ORF Transcript_7461/g.18320 Transcript_7461/m.18320 type:complete len:338 (-) Transcript_7461:182-1195(-)